MKSSVYRNAAVTACCLGLLGLLWGCLDMRVSFEATKPEASPVSNEMATGNKDLASPIAATDSDSTANPAPATTPSNKSEQNTDKTISVLAARQSQDSSKEHQYLGNLRMSNQTEQPVRLALLVRQSLKKGAGVPKTDVPAHWDFDPQEGSEKGLILSLPQGNLKIQTGDVLVAFAQDGSRRYWGPYVVGETSLPTWNAEKQEWVLVLSK